MANMTPQQAAEVLRKHANWRNSHDPSAEYVGGAKLTAAIETAIECLQATRFAVPMTRDQQTGEFVLSADKAAQALGISHHTPPTDEQIGQLFDKYTDVSVLLNPISPTHAMTRTAFIQAVRHILTSCNSK